MGAKVFWEYDSDAGTFTASTEASSFPVENLQISTLAPKWKSTGLATVDTITVDMGAAVSIDAFAFLAHDLIATDTIALTYASDSGFTTDTGQAFSVAGSTTSEHLYKYFAAISRQYWRLTITKLATETRQAGRMVLGTHYELTESTREPGFQIGPVVTTAKTVTTRGGQKYGNIGVALRRLSGTIAGLSDADKAELDSLFIANTTVVPFIVSAAYATYPETKSIYGTLNAAFNPVSSARIGIWDATIGMTEQK